MRGSVPTHGSLFINSPGGTFLLFLTRAPRNVGNFSLAERMLSEQFCGRHHVNILCSIFHLQVVSKMSRETVSYCVPSFDRCVNFFPVKEINL